MCEEGRAYQRDKSGLLADSETRFIGASHDSRSDSCRVPEVELFFEEKWKMHGECTVATVQLLYSGYVVLQHNML